MPFANLGSKLTFMRWKTDSNKSTKIVERTSTA